MRGLVQSIRERGIWNESLTTRKRHSSKSNFRLCGRTYIDWEIGKRTRELPRRKHETTGFTPLWVSALDLLYRILLLRTRDNIKKNKKLFRDLKVHIYFNFYLIFAFSLASSCYYHFIISTIRLFSFFKSQFRNIVDEQKPGERKRAELVSRNIFIECNLGVYNAIAILYVTHNVTAHCAYFVSRRITWHEFLTARLMLSHSLSRVP